MKKHTSNNSNDVTKIADTDSGVTFSRGCYPLSVVNQSSQSKDNKCLIEESVVVDLPVHQSQVRCNGSIVNELVLRINIVTKNT